MERYLKLSPIYISKCTGASSLVDATHCKLNSDHPHAHINRGWFNSAPSDCVRFVDTDWDIVEGPVFEELIEYKSIYNHIYGIEKWRQSQFANRISKWMELGGAVREVGVQTKSINRWLIEREKEIDTLIHSLKNGYIKDKHLSNNVGVNITREGEYLFNKVGHHRLAIAKCLNLDYIYVVPVVVHPLCKSAIDV